MKHDPARPLFADPITPWMPWFAWRPVRLWDGRWMWLRRISRRLCQNHAHLSFTALDQWWQYGPRRTLRDFDNETWDRFFDFLADNSHLSDEEVAAELKEAGIDMAPVHARVRELVEEHRAARPEPERRQG